MVQGSEFRVWDANRPGKPQPGVLRAWPVARRPLTFAARVRNCTPPRSLGIGLLQGPTGGLFLMSKVPLYRSRANIAPCETAKARFWPSLSGESPQNVSRCFLLARKCWGWKWNLWGGERVADRPEQPQLRVWRVGPAAHRPLPSAALTAVTARATPCDPSVPRATVYLTISTLKSRPESGHDCLTCAMFALKRRASLRAQFKNSPGDSAWGQT